VKQGRGAVLKLPLLVLYIVCKVLGQPCTDSSVFFFPFHQTSVNYFIQINWPSSNAGTHLEMFLLNFSEELAILNQIFSQKSGMK
jgi:hypothetical protein